MINSNTSADNFSSNLKCFKFDFGVIQTFKYLQAIITAINEVVLEDTLK